MNIYFAGKFFKTYQQSIHSYIMERDFFVKFVGVCMCVFLYA